MLKLFGGAKPDHPLADPKEARKILDVIAAEDPFKALEELGHWLESVSGTEGFKPDHRSRLFLQIDEAAQSHVRKLSRQYLSSARLSKFQEGRLWTSVHDYWRHSALAFNGCAECYASGQKSTDALKTPIALISVRALRALAQQMKWQCMRYGPFDQVLWSMLAKLYTQAERRGFARQNITVYPGDPGDSSAEQEFLRAAMLSASSPDGLLPMEIELAERLIAHFSASFGMVLEQQPDVAYWIDIAAGRPPLRLAKPPQRAPTLRFLAAGKAMKELEELNCKVKTSNAVPSGVNLGGSYDAAMVGDVSEHLLVYWSTQPPERKHTRHRVKTRLTVVHGLEGVLKALGASGSREFDLLAAESWIVDNVSTGGFGAVVPHVQGEWLKIGCLLGLQPEGGSNWLLGVVRRFNRDTPQQGSVGIETLAHSMLPVQLRVGAAGSTGILLDPRGMESAAEARIMLSPGVFIQGQNLEFERGDKQVLLLPQGTMELGEDYELLRCRPMLRDSAE